MKRVERTIAFRGRFLDVIWEGGAEYVCTRGGRGVVLIIPVTADGDIILIEQHRVAFGCAVIEFPAGLVGDEDGLSEESFEAAACRELVEETGYATAAVEFLLRGPSSPGSMREVVDFFLARNVVQTHVGGGVGHERIHVHRIPLGAVDDWLRAKLAEKVMIDPRVYLGVQLARSRDEAI